MLTFKEQWNLEMALEVLKNNNVDSQTWSEAAKWIMLYGPSELQQVIFQASTVATASCFPELNPDGFTETGEPCYNIEKIAETLGISKEEVVERIMKIEDEQSMQHLFDDTETKKIQ